MLREMLFVQASSSCNVCLTRSKSGSQSSGRISVSRCGSRSHQRNRSSSFSSSSKRSLIFFCWIAAANRINRNISGHDGHAVSCFLSMSRPLHQKDRWIRCKDGDLPISWWIWRLSDLAELADDQVIAEFWIVEQDIVLFKPFLDRSGHHSMYILRQRCSVLWSHSWWSRKCGMHGERSDLGWGYHSSWCSFLIVSSSCCSSYADHRFPPP